MSDLQDQMGFHLRSGTQMTWRMMLRLMQKWGGKVKSRHSTTKQKNIKIQNLHDLKQGGSQSMEFMDRNFGFTHLDMKKLDASVDWEKLEQVLKYNHVNFYREKLPDGGGELYFKILPGFDYSFEDLFKSIKETALTPEKSPSPENARPVEKDLQKAQKKQEEIKSNQSVAPTKGKQKVNPQVPNRGVKR
ncbi:hypothetical protein [Lactococcus lactis]|uniref:hypothetical protein n=1 Tax=Lactococcus lactis TaxID=1358 RepID=UPI000BA519D6|nr:hypothetical protein [Lactococcus lactis]PAK67075.1 hypothetical protein B8W94_07340 [Lactococcus lactis]PEN18591.1 hypothetical protein CRM88_07840 [Lactococcus lactis]